MLICHQHLSAACLKLGIERCRTSDQKRPCGNLWVVRISWHWNAYIDLLPQEVPTTMSQILYINMWQHATKRSIMNHTISHVGPLHYIITTIYKSHDITCNPSRRWPGMWLQVEPAGHCSGQGSAWRCQVGAPDFRLGFYWNDWTWLSTLSTVMHIYIYIYI